ncbi:MAG: hypothetical protein ACOH2J_09860 [Allorhizobium sp.]
MNYSVRKEDHRMFGGETSVLYLKAKDGSWSVFEPLVDFSHAHSRLSDATRRKSVRGFSRLYDYSAQTEAGYASRFGDEGATRWRVILQEFCNALRHGTINSDFSDATGLYWPPTSSEALLSDLGAGLDKFFDWMADQDRFQELIDVLPFLAEINLGTFGQAHRTEIAKRYRFLAHIQPQSRPGRIRPAMGATIFKGSSMHKNTGPEIGAVPLAPIYGFPGESLVSFIDRGFERKTRSKDLLENVDYTGRMYALIALGGLRGSESLHMWVNDLQVVDGAVKGFLRHPEKFVENCGASREQILLERYNRRPRTQLLGCEKVGFKNPRLNLQHWALIHWLDSDGFQDYFVQQLEFYVGVYRRTIMECRRKAGLRDHPYLLVSSHHCPSKGRYVGDPITACAAAGRWKRAIESPEVGLRYRKELGTTRHAVRHMVGQTADELGTPIHDIAKILHHRSIFSSLVYVARSDEDAHKAFEENKKRRPDVLARLGSFKSEGPR